MQDITVLDDVVLALGHDLPLGSDLGFVTELLEVGVLEDDGLDEGLLKVSVDNTSRLGRLGAVAESPLANLIGADSEEAAEIEGLAHGDNELGKSRLGADLLLLLSNLLVSLEAGQALLESDGDGDDGITRSVVLDPLGNTGKILVLLADVVLLGKVDKVHDRLGRQEEQRIDDLDLLTLLASTSPKKIMCQVGMCDIVQI